MVHDSIMSLMRAIGRMVALLVGALGVGVLLLALYVAVVWLRLPSVESLGDEGDPGWTAFMLEDSCDVIDVRWKPLRKIDPRLGCAVVFAEDLHFFHHGGVDWDALRLAFRDGLSRGEFNRGGSTIPMQLARNLFLTRSRQPSRKLRELFLAPRLVDRYERTRLLEVYLNTAEFAPCVYGAEAASRHYFGHSVRHLDLAEATFLASMLPRPRTPPGTLRGDRSRLQVKQRRLVRAFTRLRLVSVEESRAAGREIVRFWSQGWRRHAPTSSGPASRGWYRRACGTGRNP